MNPLPEVLKVRLARLSAEWQPLNTLKIQPNDGDYGFSDLAVAGIAEVKREPITRSGIACGERTFYRLAS